MKKGVKIVEIKKKMLAWRDFWDGDIMYRDMIEEARTKKQLAEVMDMYYRHLENACNDALRHCEEFKRTLGLNNF